MSTPPVSGAGSATDPAHADVSDPSTPDAGHEPAGPPSATLPRPARYTQLDGLRVVGMFMVLLTHAETSSRANTSGVVHDLLGRGDAALPIFLQISAFLLLRPVVLGLIDGTPRSSFPRYIARRLIRIYPGYWVILVILIAIEAVELQGVGDYFLAITLLYPLFASPFVGSNFLGLGQTWMVILLLQLYILFPFLDALMRRILRGLAPAEQQRQLLGWCAGIFVAGTACRSILSFGTPTWELRAIVALPVWLDSVAPGLALAVVVAGAERGLPLPQPFRFVKQHPTAGWLGAIALYLLFSQVEIPEQIGTIGPEYSLRYLVYSVFSILLVAPAVLTLPDSGLVPRVLSSRPMKWVSLLTVGFFIGHLGIMGKVESALGYEPFRAALVPLVLVTVPATMAVALVGYLVAERPVAAWTNRHLR